MIQEAFDFLSSAGVYHIATVDSEGKPHVRPFGSKMLLDGKIYISCSLPKNVYDQLSGQKWVEISAQGEGMEWMRISAKAREVADPQEKEKVFGQSAYKGGAMARTIDQVAFFELAEATATIYGAETKVISW
jgi:uncharacterized pyridoxamine 5'-phosphate oxidase family protein